MRRGGTPWRSWRPRGRLDQARGPSRRLQRILPSSSGRSARPRLCAQLLEELREVESEGVSIVEDDDNAQDASFRGLKAKNALFGLPVGGGAFVE